MLWPHIIHSTALIAAALASAFVGGIAWRRRHVHGGDWLFLLVMAVFIWSLGSALQELSVRFSVQLFWARVQIIGKSSSPLFFIFYALSFARRRMPRPWMMWALGIVPLMTVLAAFTNEAHHQLWRSVIWSPATGHLAFESGPLDWLGIAYAYALIAAAGVILLLAALTLRHVYQRQAFVLLAAMVPPMVLNILALLRSGELALDLTPLGFSLSAMLLVYSMRRNRMADLVPVVRELMLDIMEDGMVVTDDAGRVVDLNRAGAHILGTDSPDRWLGCKLEELPGPATTWKELSHGCIEQAEIAIEGPAGWRVFDIKATPLSQRPEEAKRLLLTLRDVTARQQALQALETANARLRAEVAAHERLIADLDAFGHTVAHDLKSPLSQMAAAADLLADESVALDEPTAREMTAMIRSSAFKAAHIVDELLVLASTRRQDIPLEPLAMDQVVASVLRRIAPEIEASAATIHMPQTWPEALGNPIWIEEVWWNYLSNGIKYGGTPPILQLGSMVEEQAVRFWVKDNGDGIAPEAQRAIFDPHVRANGSGNGHGLGLSIARSIVEKLGGRVAVESSCRPGAGATFSFTLLPISAAPSGAHDLPQPRAREGALVSP